MTSAQPFLSFAQGGQLWKSAREHCDFTSTQIVRMLGIHPYCSPQKVWREMTGQQTESEANNTWNLEWGHKYEGPVKEALKKDIEETGLWVKTYKDKYLVGATPDGLIHDAHTLEIKCSVPLRNGDYKEPVTAVPFYDIPQVLMQMELTDRPYAYYARWNGTDTIALFLMEHDPDFLREMLDCCCEFVDNYVKTKKQPPRSNAGVKAIWMRKCVEYTAQYTSFVENIEFIPAS